MEKIEQLKIRKQQLLQQQQLLRQQHYQHYPQEPLHKMDKFYGDNLQDPLLTSAIKTKSILPQKSTNSNHIAAQHQQQHQQQVHQITRPERNLWRTGEVMEMLNIVQNSNAVQMLNCKTIKNENVFMQVEQIMRSNGYTKKSHLQIWTKWKFLKSTYMTSKRNAVMPRMIPPKIYELMHQILGSDKANEETTCETLQLDPSYHGNRHSSSNSEVDADELEGDDEPLAENIDELTDNNSNMPHSIKISSVEGSYGAAAKHTNDSNKNLDIAHPIFGFRLMDVKNEPAETAHDQDLLELNENERVWNSSTDDSKFQSSFNEQMASVQCVLREDDDVVENLEKTESREFITNHLPISQNDKKPTEASKEANLSLRIAPFAKESNVDHMQLCDDSPPPPLTYANHLKVNTILSAAAPTAVRKEQMVHKRSPYTRQNNAIRQQLMERQPAPGYVQTPDKILPQLSNMLQPTVPTMRTRKPRGPYNVHKKMKTISPAEAAVGLQRKRRLDIPWSIPTAMPETAEPPLKIPKYNSIPSGNPSLSSDNDPISLSGPTKRVAPSVSNQMDAKLLRKQQKLMDKSLNDLVTSIHKMQREMLESFFEKQMELVRREHAFQAQQDMMLMRAFQDQSTEILRTAKKLLKSAKQDKRKKHQKRQEKHENHKGMQQHYQQQELLRQQNEQNLVMQSHQLYRQQAQPEVKTKLSLVNKKSTSGRVVQQTERADQQTFQYSTSSSSSKEIARNIEDQAENDETSDSDSSSDSADTGSSSSSDSESDNNEDDQQLTNGHEQPKENGTAASYATKRQHLQSNGNAMMFNNEVAINSEDDDEEDD